MRGRIVLFLLAFATVSFASCAELFQNSRVVRLTVSTDKPTYRSGEKVVASYRLQNVGDRKLFVPVRFSADCISKPRWSTQLRHQAERQMPNGMVGDCHMQSFPDFLEKLKADSKLLSPGQHYAPEETFDTTGLKPGFYRVTAHVAAWKPTDFTEADRQELCQLGEPLLTGTLSSSVTIRLVP